MRPADAEEHRELVQSSSDGSSVSRVPGPPCDCDQCHKPDAFWRYEITRGGVTEFEGTYCSIRCRSLAARHRDETRPTGRPERR